MKKTLILVFAVLLIVGGFYIYRTETNNSELAVLIKPQETIISNEWITYQNSNNEYKNYDGKLINYTFTYPLGWTIKEGAGAAILTSNTDKGNCNLAIGGGVASRGIIGWTILKKTQVTIDGSAYTSWFLETDNTNHKYALFTTPSGVGRFGIEFGGYVTDERRLEECSSIFESILNSFRALD